MKKKLLITIIIVISVIILVTGGLVAIFSYIGYKHEKEIAKISISDIDLSQIDDGTYVGECDVFPIIVKVKVTVENHKITDVELVKHQNGKGQDANIIPDKVEEAQSLQVDTVTGATSSSKVILKAIEIALTSKNG